LCQPVVWACKKLDA